MRRRAARKDHNQNEIVAALVKAGVAVTDLSGAGEGITDLLASYRQKWFVLEVKNPKVPLKDRKLTPAQTAWHARQHAPVHIVETAEQALQVVGATAPPLPPRWQADHVS